MKLKHFTDNPMQDITNGAFDFYKSIQMRYEAQKIVAAVCNENSNEINEALIEFYTSASAYAVAITIERLLTAEQKQIVDEAVAKHRTEMVDDMIAQIFKDVKPEE